MTLQLHSVALLLLALLCVVEHGARQGVGAQILRCEHERTPESVSNRKCTKSCRRDADCLSPKKHCLCDGKCGRSCINPNQRCYPEHLDIQNGRVSIVPYNKFEAMASYTCNDGYTLDGLPARVCQGDETWSGEAPRCQLKHGLLDDNEYCDSAPRVNHARHDGPPGKTKFDKGTNLQFRCDPGYTEHKDSVTGAWCVGNGVWVGPNLTCLSRAPGCGNLSSIDNGEVHVSANIPGARASYHCGPGFFLVGSRQRICQRDGLWSGDEPSCSKVICGPPPTVERAESNAAHGQISFNGGHELIYTCETGYFPIGSTRAVCHGDKGVWWGPDLNCTARDCSHPDEIEHGYITTMGYRYTYPNKVYYGCNPGYEFRSKMSSPSRTCTASGEWAGEMPECIPINCKALGPPIHGTMIGSGMAFGVKLTFTCNAGYKVVGSRERQCQSDGEWTGQEATCEKIDCGVPERPANGYLDGHETTWRAMYKFGCNIRTKIQGDIFETHCLEDGKWSAKTPLCLGQCMVQAISKGSILNVLPGTWVDHGQTLQPVCTDGLQLDDTRTMRCNNGSWNVIPKCVPAPCKSPPPLLENGHRVYFRVAHDSKARYFCMAGYKLKDQHRYMICQRGKWAGIRPRCIEDYCERPGKLKNGKIYKNGSHGKFEFHDYIKTIKHGDRLTYECRRNYKLVGPRGAACVNGRWSPRDKPVCKESRHPLFNKLFYPHQEREAGRKY